MVDPNQPQESRKMKHGHKYASKDFCLSSTIQWNVFSVKQFTKLKTQVFWDIMLCSYYCFRWAFWFHLQGSPKDMILHQWYCQNLKYYNSHSVFTAYCTAVHANKCRSGRHKIWLCTSHFFLPVMHQTDSKFDSSACSSMLQIKKKASFAASRPWKWPNTLWWVKINTKHSNVNILQNTVSP